MKDFRAGGYIRTAGSVLLYNGVPKPLYHVMSVHVVTKENRRR